MHYQASHQHWLLLLKVVQPYFHFVIRYLLASFSALNMTLLWSLRKRLRQKFHRWWWSSLKFGTSLMLLVGTRRPGMRRQTSALEIGSWTTSSDSEVGHATFCSALMKLACSGTKLTQCTSRSLPSRLREGNRDGRCLSNRSHPILQIVISGKCRVLP